VLDIAALEADETDEIEHILEIYENMVNICHRYTFICFL
jgi:hypothetical protein